MIHRGFEAWIAYADGQRLSEYDIEYDGKKAICYIPSKRGKRFMICWKYHSGQHRAGVQVRIDGASVGCKTSRPGETGKRIGMRTGSFADGAYHAFEFADLVTVAGEDGDMFMGLKRDAQPGSSQPRRNKLGTICVRVYHIKPDLESPMPFPPRPVPFTGVCAVNEEQSDEKKNKLTDGAHCVRLGPKIRPKWSEGAKQGAVMSLLNKDDGPFVSFEFRYRPASVLQAEGLMPRSELKKLTDVEDEDESDSDAESNSEIRTRAGHAPMSRGGIAAIIRKCARSMARPSAGLDLRD
ncbi:hypothetical protein FKP32DRAFT_1674914 [Trametes sanguinea]|nr:hypothetical protein FKP32DRAFT_1674914 [Trametes sanguinea]